MKCLLKYPWVKLPQDRVPGGKGLMGSWMRLAARAAFRKGERHYCGYDNPVEPGMWVGGIVGLKAILGLRRRNATLDILRKLERLGYLSWSLDPSTKKLGYSLSDWLVRFSGAECPGGAVYTTEGCGFVCVSREITQRLVEQNYKFEESDAWLDLWCHTTVEDSCNAFSFFAPAVQYGKYGAILTLGTLGRRWGWEKTPSYFDGDTYIQHNTGIADGLSSLGAALGALAAQGIQMVYDTIHQVLAQGNYVLAVSEGTFGGAPTSYYDLWRVENGKVTEHWDVMETIAAKETWQNQNGKF